LKTLLEGDGTTPPILPEGSYKHVKSESCIKIINGGQILYAGADDEQRITSLNLSGAAIDQAEELSEIEYQSLNGRTRLGIKGLGISTYSVCNPSSPEHHLAIRFGCVEGRSLENWRLMA
jgi:phage terminase large subunit